MKGWEGGKVFNAVVESAGRRGLSAPSCALVTGGGEGVDLHLSLEWGSSQSSGMR